MKRRIYSAGKSLRILMTHRFGTDAEQEALTREDRDIAELSTLAHVLKDDVTVKIYNDRDMGGLVVDYTDE